MIHEGTMYRRIRCNCTRRNDDAVIGGSCRMTITFLRFITLALSPYILLVLVLVVAVPRNTVVSFQCTTSPISRIVPQLFDRRKLHMIPMTNGSQQNYYSQNKVAMGSTSAQSFWFQSKSLAQHGLIHRRDVSLSAAQQSSLTEKEVQKSIDKVVSALRNDSRANKELGKLQRVTIVLGFGMQQMDTIMAVRFNASFKRSGTGLSSIPLPFGLGQSNESEGRGTMVGQVKASINVKTGKVISCSVFRDLGYGRTFDLKV